MDREQMADLGGRKLTRGERMALRIADLRECTPERRAQLRQRALLAIKHATSCHERANANGANIPPLQLQRNISSCRAAGMDYDVVRGEA